MKETGGLPRHGQKVFVCGKEAGWVSSGTIAPSLGKGAGLAYLPRELKIGDEFEIEVRPGKLLKAERVNLPMVKGSVRK
ncbi:MAG: glycine cleavage T C-terminal barrel domain-containing protein, partial [Candidatus Hydrothermia bacterium]